MQDGPLREPRESRGSPGANAELKAVAIRDDRIHTIYVIGNADKLQNLPRTN